ncbi:hypothetical protein JXO52_02545 [bacterium]|nr:hypothetical protein [bacterium]
MKKAPLFLLAASCIILQLSCSATKIIPAADVDPASIVVVASKAIGVSGGTGIIAPPAISPDGMKKFSVSMGGGKLYLENADGSEKTVVYEPKDDPAFDKMAPLDEARLAEMPDNAGDVSEYIRNVYEKDPRKGAALAALVAFSEMTEKMGEDIRNIIDIAWSPDGSKAALLVYAPVSYKAIYFIMDAGTFKTEELINFYPPVHEDAGKQGQSGSVTHNCGVSWKSDDTVVLSTFMGAEGAEYYNLAEVAVENGAETVISENDVIKAYYSPDGGKVAFFRPGGEYAGSWFSSKSSLESYFSTLDLYVGDADFSNAERIASGIHENKKVSWSDDGRYLAYVQDGKKSITGTTSTLKFYDTKEKVSKEICTAKFLNTPLFIGRHIYFFVGGTHTYKARI